MDYLLRDSLHAGVAYGKFDHYRLIDTLRILPKSERENDSKEPVLGLTAGGLQSAEALIWARYFMFSQVYLHPVRRIYDIHLKDFLKKWLEGGKFSINIEDFLGMTDNKVIVEMQKAVLDSQSLGHIHAKRIIKHKHFKVLYKRNNNDQKKNRNAIKEIYKATCAKYGKDSVRSDEYTQPGSSQIFPVLEDEKILQSIEESATLNEVPVVATGFVFIDRDHLSAAKEWLKDNRDDIIKPLGVID